MLVAARHEDGSPMSEAEMRDELLTLLVAGHETTATALSWAMERLVRHPEKLERLRAETLAGEDAYLTATIQETLRLRPVIVLVAQAADRAGRDRRLRAARRGHRHPLHPPRSTATPRSTPSRTASCPSASSRTRRAPTPGSPSAAASAAASAPPSPSSRWPSSSASWSSATGSARPAPSPSAPSAARSPRRRGTTPKSSSAEPRPFLSAGRRQRGVAACALHINPPHSRSAPGL